jgi:DNA-binding response OmpR family regulator
VGARIFVVEDEFLSAQSLADDLRERGYDVVGPFADLATATVESRRQSFDAALLDVNLGGTMVFPLADELAKRGIPFVFLSGYEPTTVPERFRGAAKLPKPCDPVALDREIRRLLVRSPR